MEIPKELRQRMEWLVQSTIEKYQLNGLSSPEEVAAKLGLTIQNGKMQKVDGLFHSDTKTIIINENVKLDQRKRFTLFHEICHFLLRNDDDFFSELNDLYDNDEEFLLVEEKLCNIGASEFISPRSEVTALIDEKGFSIDLLFELELRYNLSKQSAMWRLAECVIKPCILAIYLAEYEMSPLFSISIKDIAVESTWNSNRTPYKLKRGTSIPTNHPIRDSILSFDDTFFFKNSFIQFASGNQMLADVEGTWINDRGYVIFHLKN